MSGPAPVTCAVCGVVAEDVAPPTWSMETGERGVRLVCADCTRANIRSIEGKLDEAWW
ncbi:MAG TPA: hypothetical protein VEZ46_04270 [Mycobacteriales bacterium]|jgi:hypothetical protein|nr:hypothetical protein [Mycobacteriales bacterium]